MLHASQGGSTRGLGKGVVIYDNSYRRIVVPRRPEGVVYLEAIFFFVLDLLYDYNKTLSGLDAGVPP